MDVEEQQANPRIGSGNSTRGGPAVCAAVVRFRIGGLLAFLSHAETLRLFERACARAAIGAKYTQGFNPHPKLSLPLPRAVGVVSDDELLVIGLADQDQPDRPAAREMDIAEAIRRVLPAHIEVVSVTLLEQKVSYHPRRAEHAFTLGRDRASDFVEALRGRIARILTSESLIVERGAPGARRSRRVDVRPFLASIRLIDGIVQVTSRITPTGSIRIDEIMQLLGLKADDLAASVRRTAVEWTAA